ncbi:MAG: anti-sigma factor [Stellaceae bacterium]
MRYDNPDLRELLAAEYVLGTMPHRARLRFEQVMTQDPALAELVGAWAERFSAIDRATLAEEPPARVWRAVEARIAAPGAPAQPVAGLVQPLRAALRLWRGFAVAASAVAAALIIYIAVSLTGPAPQMPRVIAVLTDRSGAPSWITTAGPQRGEIAVAALRPITSGAGHSLELWGITAGKPRPLGLLRPQPGQPTVLSAKGLPASGGVLAVSLEPPGGSPTGLPTGAVLFQGKVIPRS